MRSEVAWLNLRLIAPLVISVNLSRRARTVLGKSELGAALWPMTAVRSDWSCFKRAAVLLLAAIQCFVE